MHQNTNHVLILILYDILWIQHKRHGLIDQEINFLLRDAEMFNCGRLDRIERKISSIHFKRFGVFATWGGETNCDG